MKKKLLALVLAAAMTLSLASCGGSKTETPSTGSDNSSASSDNSSAEGATYKVGICQLVQHPALDAATQGFIDALNEALPGQVEFENKNASGEANNCGTIVNGFVSEGVDLIMANATAALTAAASATADIPILGTSVTEYGVAHMRGRSLGERARQLIAIAHPDFRDELTFEAKKRGIMI